MPSRRIIRTSLASFWFLAGGLGLCHGLAAQEPPQTVDILVGTGTFAGDELRPDVRIIVTGQAPLGSTVLGSCCGTTELYPIQHALSLLPGQAAFFSRFHKLQLVASARSGISGCSNEPLKAGTRLKDLELVGLCLGGIYDRYRATIVTPPAASLLDADLDALSDADEELLGTDPNVPDTDGDGLLDGTEFELSIAEGWGTADPLNLDSDGDLLLDGEEVTIYGTSPGKADTDGDRIPDAYDFHPLQPDQVGGYVEETARALALEIAAMDPTLFTGPNRNAQQGRRNGLVSSLQTAANQVKNGQAQAAVAALSSVLARLDGAESPDDWMILSAQAAVIRDHLVLLVALSGA